MTFPIPKQAAVAIAGGVLAVVLGVGVLFLGGQTQANPADILPMEHTLALVRNADQDTISRMQTYVAGLDDITLPDHPVDVALLSLPNGRTAWAIFDATTAPAGTRFSISASDPAVQSMIGEGDARLADAGPYDEVKAFLENGPAAYLRFPDLPLKPATTVTSLFAPNTPAAALFAQDKTRLILPQDEPLEALSSVLSPSARTLLQSRIRTLTASLLGSTVSPAYDLLPLVGSSLSLQVRNGTNVILSGEARSSSDARTAIDNLHAAFAAGQPGVEVVSMPLDDQFSYTGVRQTDNSVTRTTEEHGGYTIDKSTGARATFLSARRGSSVILATTDEGLRAAIDTMASSPSNHVFSVFADAPSIQAALPNITAPVTQVQWTVVRESGRLMLEIPR